MNNLSSDVYDYIEKIDAYIYKKGISVSKIETRTIVGVLFSKGSIEVGYRACCGKTHDTQKVFREWLKILKFLRKKGYTITEEPVKHKNSYATLNGGFWSSIIYTLVNP